MRTIFWFLVVAVTSLAVLSHADTSTGQSAQPFRAIPIPTREHGYTNFESIAIRSDDELDSFLRSLSVQRGWNNKGGFEDAVRDVKVDFSKEALLLLRHTEGSGSIPVVFETPVLQARKLIFSIRGKLLPPGYLGTADMAYYCFAVAVSKSHVSQVELNSLHGDISAGRQTPIVFSIVEK
jgi:hypothetical protein